MSANYTVVYDGNCRVCNRLAAAAGGRSDKLEIVASQNPGVRERFPWISDAAYAESVQLIRADGATWQGAAAVERVIDMLPKGRLVSWIFSIPMVRPLAERLYRWFAQNRYRLGCSQHCRR